MSEPEIIVLRERPIYEHPPGWVPYHPGDRTFVAEGPTPEGKTVFDRAVVTECYADHERGVWVVKGYKG